MSSCLFHCNNTSYFTFLDLSSIVSNCVGSHEIDRNKDELYWHYWFEKPTGGKNTMWWIGVYTYLSGSRFAKKALTSVFSRSKKCPCISDRRLPQALVEIGNYITPWERLCITTLKFMSSNTPYLFMEKYNHHRQENLNSSAKK